MRGFTAAAILVLAGATATAAAEMPTRKSGLWEISINVENRNVPAQTIQQCTDAATDQALQSNAGPVAGERVCSKREISRSGNTVTIDTICTVGGRATTGHTVMTGDFGSAYIMTVTSQTDRAQGGPRTTNMSAKWVGPCTGDQKPGDVILPDGRKFNVNNMHPPAAGGAAAPPR